MWLWLTRGVLALLGLAALVFGAVLAVRFALASTVDGRTLAVWLVGGPVLHDALLAPAVGGAGLLIARRLGPAWRAPVQIGSAVSAVLVLLAVPALWRANAPAANPGLDDRNYPLGLAVYLAVVWLGVLVAGLLRRRALSSPTRAGRRG
jgi:hypothetical protein